MIGETISHYKILEKIAEGGMGVVYKAEDIILKRLVALKFLPPEFTRDQVSRERFKREAQAAAALNNPNIVTIHEINDYNGYIYIVMEYIEGIPLNVKAKRSGKAPSENHLNTSPLKINEIINISIQVCHGLKAAHRSGIIHRDVKPQNILITKEGAVKILDFGVAKLKGTKKITREYSTVGTIHYMAPEQIKTRNIDQRADIWSLGVVLYEVLTGELPFKGEKIIEVMESIVNKNPRLPGELYEDIPEELERIILKCIRKKKGERYQDVDHLLADLNKLLNASEQLSRETDGKEKKAVRKETERRQATVIFAEIDGYAEMMQQLDTEESAVVINSCFEMLRSVVEKYGGNIDNMTDGTMMVLFGVPAAIEHAPKKAINTAIEMRNNLQQFNREKEPTIPLNIHMGINTGIMIVGAIGKEKKQEYTVIGGTIRLAVQLKDLSMKGQIYVGQSTYRYTREDFAYKRLKPIAVSGYTYPVPIFELLSTREKIYQPEFGIGRLIQSEMVGRDKELDKLRLHVLKVINGEGSIISVVGEAGIGKSRLISELKKMEPLQKVRLLEGRALSIGKNLSYHPIIDILKNSAGIKDEDSEIESLSKLETAIVDIYPEGLEETFPFVATMMGMKLTGKYAERVKGIEGDSLEKLILKNVRELIIKSAERGPTVYIIENLHWADVSSIELLESLFPLAESYRILLINVLRPNYPETGERILKILKEEYDNVHQEIYLEPLEKKHIDILIRNLIKVSELPPDVDAAISTRAEGNPFFIEEVIRSFIDEGVVELKDGKFTITEKIDSVVIPETIQDVIMARIDRLDEAAKSLLKEASVIGRYFFRKILIAVAEYTDNLDERLEQLKNVQLIQERTRLEEIEYLFKHILVQEVAYESILLKKRRELHLRAAQAIESIFSEKIHEFYGMLALHYSRAENLEKAEEYLIKAGEEALKAAASSEALNYYQDALKIYLNKSGDTVDPEKIFMMEKNIALAFYNKGHMSDALEYLDKVLAYRGIKKSKCKITALLNLAGNFLNVLKNLYFPSKRREKFPESKTVEIINLLDKRLTVFTQVENARFFTETIELLKRLNQFDITGMENGVSIYTACSTLFFLAGISFKLSRKILDNIKDYIDKNDIKAFFRYKYLELLYNYFSGDNSRKFEYDEDLIDTNIKTGDLFFASSYIQWNGLSKINQGHWGSVNLLLEKLHEIGESYGYNLAVGRKYCVRTKLLLYRRNLQDALDEIEEGVLFLNRIGLTLYSVFVLGMKAYTQILLKDIKGAEKSLLQLKELISHENLIIPFYLSNFLISQFLFDLYMLEESTTGKNKRKAPGYQKKAYHSGKIAVKNAKKFAPIKPEAFKLMGLYYWFTGKQKKALKWWSKSIKFAEYFGARPDLARTYLEVGKRLLDKKSKYQKLAGIPAKEYLEKARVLFKEMELDQDLDELAVIKK